MLTVGSRRRNEEEATSSIDDQQIMLFSTSRLYRAVENEMMTSAIDKTLKTFLC